MSGKASKILLNSFIVMVLMSLLVAVVFISVSPWYYLGLGRSPILHIGYLGDQHDGLYASVEAAVTDINHSVGKMSPSPPTVAVKWMGTDLSQLNKFYHQDGLRVFLVPGEAESEALQKELKVGGYNEATIVTLAILDDNEENERRISTNMPLREEIQAYLTLMASNNPSDKPLEIVPVWETGPTGKTVYDLFSKEIQEFNTSLKSTLPVTYEASQYPRTDGLQAVSEISSRLVLHPTAHIFFLTSSRLREVIEASDMNKALTHTGRRWYARGLLELKDTLEAMDTDTDKVEFCKKTSLTTLSYLASEDSMESRELIRRSMGHENGSARTYLKALTYSTIYDLHKAYTRGLLLQQSYRSILRKIVRDDVGTSRVAAALTYHGGQPKILPMKNWMVMQLVKTNLSDVEVEMVATHPLHRQELEVIINSTLEVEECRQPRVKFWLHPSLILPQVSLEFSEIGLIPESGLILPAQRGISVSLQCSLQASITAHCVPRKFNQGSLTCRMASESTPSTAAVKSKRSIVDSNGSLATLWKDWNKNVKPIWSDLAPSVFTCAASLAGCDFCFYYLATYNLSVAPAACVGGCSLSTFGSCSGVISTSIIKTLELD